MGLRLRIMSGSGTRDEGGKVQTPQGANRIGTASSFNDRHAQTTG